MGLPASVARRAMVVALVAMASRTGFSWAQDEGEPALRARHAAFAAAHVRDAAGQPLQIESRDDSHRIMGEIYALLPYSFDAVAAAVKDPAHWCEILLLHLDTKDCAVTNGATRPVLHAGVVSHYDQPASTAYRVDFGYRLVRDAPAYIQARLGADDGPIDTTDFRIVFEAMRADDGATFAHMSYAYSYGRMSDLAVRLYLATLGRGKVGFTVVGRGAGGEPQYIGGMRGVVERNTMRYYLAVEAWLSALGLPREARIMVALRNWHAAVERYPRQLHDLSERRYLDMKRRELGLPPE
ncbi:MAG: hypothetical protein ACM3SO_22835 [Betaproteobacteria bacterium]